MTVKELKNALSYYDDDIPVVMFIDYKDGEARNVNISDEIYIGLDADGNEVYLYGYDMA